MEEFKIGKHNKVDKEFILEGGAVYAHVDYDDVDHCQVDASAEAMVEVLNNYLEEYNAAYKRLLKIKMTSHYHDKLRHNGELYDDYPTLEAYLKSRNIEP